ncbi:hypothetical protein DVS77_23665 [Mycolicibacterium moriokaense]|nr:hypothetical protein DVS77_23665 [Mycolicibacterium moriokaense]
MAAAGVLVAAPAADADPAGCAQFGFDGRYELTGSNGWWVTFNSTGPRPTGSATVNFLDGGKVSGNIIDGAIAGRAFTLAIVWGDKPNNIWDFYGTVGDDGQINDGGESLRNIPGDYGGEVASSWRSVTPLKCMDAPAASPPAAPAQKTATVVGGDVDVYNIAHDDVDTGDGVVGVVIGRLVQGQKVPIAGKCALNDWCKISLPDQTPGFVFGHLAL